MQIGHTHFLSILLPDAGTWAKWPEPQKLSYIASVTLRIKTTHQDSGTKGNTQSLMTSEWQHTPWAADTLISITGERSRLLTNFTHSCFRVSSLGSGWVGEAMRFRVKVCSCIVWGGSLKHLVTDIVRILINQNGCWCRGWKMLLCLVLILAAKLCGNQGVPGKGLGVELQRKPFTKSNKVFQYFKMVILVGITCL